MVKLGHMYGMALDILVSQGSGLTAPDISVTQATKTGTLVADFAAGTADKQVVDGIYAQLASYQSNNQFVQYLLSTLAPATTIDMLNTYAPLPAKTQLAALQSLIANMGIDSATVQASVVASSAAVAGTPSPVGDPIIVTSVKQGNGLSQEYMFAETLTFKCTADAQTGGATKFQETMQVNGAVAASSGLAYNWPLGSGLAGLTLNCIDGVQNNSGGNLLQNSGFDTFSNGASGFTPDNWIAITNEAGMSQSTGTVLRGTSSLQFTGQSSTLTSLTQTFNTTPSATHAAGGTAAKLLPDVPYPFCIFYKLSATSPGAGVLAANLLDGSNTIIVDDQTVANTISVALTGVVDTNWHALSGYFRLPKNLPSTIKIRIWLSTGLSTGTNLFLDLGAMGGISGSSGGKLLYPGGPYAAVFSQDVAPLLNDYWTVAASNTRGRFQELFQRVFNMPALGLQLLSAGSPSISDSLVA